MVIWKGSNFQNSNHNFNDKYLPILGNHDTNYQGVDDEETPNSGILSNKALKNILFPNSNKMYYTLKKNNTRLYIFDSGIDCWKFIK